MLRVDLFERALRETIAESPGLRLPQRSGPVQFKLPVLDFRTRRPTCHGRAMDADRDAPADTAGGPALFRFALIRVGDDHTLWFQKFHHIIIDATGRRLLSDRIARRYRACGSANL